MTSDLSPMGSVGVNLVRGLRDASISFRTSNTIQAQTDSLATLRPCKEFRMTGAQRVREGANSQHSHPQSGGSHMMAPTPPYSTSGGCQPYTFDFHQMFLFSSSEHPYVLLGHSDKPYLTVSMLPPLQFNLPLQHISGTCLWKACFVVQQHWTYLGVS